MVQFFRNHINLVVFCYFVLVTLFVTNPLIFHLDTLSPGLGDQLLVNWIINWNLHALFHEPLHIFNAPIFFPYHNTLAYSESFFTSSLLAAIPLFLLREPAVAYSWNLILALCTLGFFTYLLSYYLTKNYFASIIGGTLAAFCIFTLGKISVLQLVSIQYVPLSLYFFIRYLDSRKNRFFYLFCLTFLLQMYNSFLPGYFIIFSVIVLSLVRKEVKNIILNKHVIISTGITFLLLLPVAIPYFAVSREFHYVRDIRDTINFASRIDYSFYPPDTTILQKPLMQLFYPHDPNRLVYIGYLGLAFYLLLLISAVCLLTFRNIRNKSWIVGFGAIAVLGYVLSLGPALQWGEHIIKKPFIIPLPYVFFYYLVPGFKGMRNSGRWEMLFVFAAAVFFSLIIANLFERQKKWYQVVFTILISLIIFLEISYPLDYVPVIKKEQFPKIYSYLATLPERQSMIEMPFYSWYMSPYSSEENMREYYNTLHYHPMVNGYSGFSPKEWEERSNEYEWSFPDAKTVSYLRSINLTYILLHKKEYDILEKNRYTVNGRRVSTWYQVQKRLKKYPFIRLKKQFGDDYLYEITY